VRRRGRVGSVTAVPGVERDGEKASRVVRFIHACLSGNAAMVSVGAGRRGAATPRWRTRDLRRERRELRTAVAVARRKHGS
jgi:hypothetical protein